MGVKMTEGTHQSMILKYEVASPGGWTTLHARQKKAGSFSRGCLHFQQFILI